MVTRREMLSTLGKGTAALATVGFTTRAVAQHEGHNMAGMNMPGMAEAPVTPAPGLEPPENLKRHSQGYLPVRTLAGCAIAVVSGATGRCAQ